jgi:hypothetical protein
MTAARVAGTGTTSETDRLWVGSSAVVDARADAAAHAVRTGAAGRSLGFAEGNLRTNVETSGCGRVIATRCSTSRLFL